MSIPKWPLDSRTVLLFFLDILTLFFIDLVDACKVMIYVDDILIPSETIEENLEVLKLVFNLLVQNNLTLRLDKCAFLATRITHLGYVIEDSQIKPSDEHILAIKNYPQPRNVKELQSFIGLASFFRKFVRNFSVIAKPLHDVVRKNVNFYFGPDQISAFNRIKDLLSSQPVLSIYSPKAETQLHCDASSLGFAGILLQRQNDGKFHPVSYFSQRASQAESKLHSFELEMLGIVYSINRLRTYLHGITFKIITDCNSLNLALKKREINPRIMKWSLVLQNYDYTLEHRRGNLCSTLTH